MTDKEALKLALEALGLYQTAGFGNSTDFNKQHEAFYKAQTTITAIKQALAAPVQPVKPSLWEQYHAAQPAPVQPVSGVVLRDGYPTLIQDKHIKETDHRLCILPTTPPAAQRQWVGLTDEQIKAIEAMALTKNMAIAMTMATLKEINI